MYKNWEEAKHKKEMKVRCPRCRPYHATHVDFVADKVTYAKVKTHELDDCFIHVCINHNIVWRQMKEE